MLHCLNLSTFSLVNIGDSEPNIQKEHFLILFRNNFKHTGQIKVLSRYFILVLALF